MQLEIDRLNGFITINGEENYFKESDKETLLDKEAIGVLEKWDIDTVFVEEKISEILYDIFNSRENDFEMMVDYYPENAGYYWSKIKELQNDRQKLGLI